VGSHLGLFFSDVLLDISSKELHTGILSCKHIDAIVLHFPVL
jgi:hypothetical protein